jgi:hypothetical protein
MFLSTQSRKTSRRQVRGGGFEPPRFGSKPKSLPLADPRERPAGVEPACPAWGAGASAARPRTRWSAECGDRTHVTCLEGRSPAAERTPHRGGGRGGSRTLKARARPLSRRVPSPFGSPFRRASTGGRNRTCGLLFNREVHEPAHASPVGWSRGGRIRTGALLVPNQADWPGFPTPRSSSAQRESNPHFRHGKAVGCRYIMGTIAEAELSKRAPGGTRTHVAALRVRSLRRWTTSASRRVGPEGLEPSPAWLRARCAAANTLVPSCFTESAREESNLRRAVIGRLFCR